MLTTKNLTKIFRKKDTKTKQVLEFGIRDINLSVNSGRIFGLIGANGAGKTTTMRILAGLTHGDSGEVRLNNQDYSQIKNLKKRVAFVSGDTQPYDRMTPYETLTLFARLAELDEKTIRERIERLSLQLGMTDFLHVSSGDFSTGMKQKLAIARALVVDPEVLIFDEITNGLDIFVARSVKDIILDLKKQNKIILYSTHIMPDADEICDEIAIIHQGKVIDSGVKNDLLTKHNSTKCEELFFKLVSNSNE